MQLKSAERYWNPHLETLPPRQLRDFQFKKFKRIVKWGYENSRLYRQLYEKAGFNPDDLQDWEDISKVPVVQKKIIALLRQKNRIPWYTLY